LTPDQKQASDNADKKLPAGWNEVTEARDYKIKNLTTDEEVDYSLSKPESITIRFYYPGNYPRSDELQLRIVRLNEGGKEWEVQSPYELNRNENWIQIKVSHFSIYKLVIFPFDTVSGAYVYPNPFKPGDAVYGGADDGRGIVFADLPSKAEIRIFNIAGELVDKISHSGGNSYQWEKAEKIASGVYIAIVTSSDGKVKTIKFSVVK